MRKASRCHSSPRVFSQGLQRIERPSTGGGALVSVTRTLLSTPTRSTRNGDASSYLCLAFALPMVGRLLLKLLAVTAGGTQGGEGGGRKRLVESFTHDVHYSAFHTLMNHCCFALVLVNSGE